MSPKTPHNILFIRTDRIGDFLLNLPAIHALKETFPKAKISVLIHPYLYDLLYDHPDIDELISFTPVYKTSFFSWLLFFIGLKKKKYDLVVVSNPHKLLHFLTFLIRIPMRVGYHRKWGLFLTHKMRERKQEYKKHEVEYNLDLVSLCGARLNQIKNKNVYFLPVTHDPALTFLKQSPLDVSKPFVVINPYTTNDVKQWPIEQFIKLIQLLSKEDFQIVLIGGALESQRIKKEMLPYVQNANVIDLSGKLTLKQLSTTLKLSSLLISNDSGPVHIAAAVCSKTLVLFGQKGGSNLIRWAPWNPSHKPIHMLIEKADIRDISVELVWKSSIKHLQSSY